MYTVWIDYPLLQTIGKHMFEEVNGTSPWIDRDLVFFAFH
jgi:hypothetical protein